MTIELQLFRDNARAHHMPVTERPIMIGRAPSNDLVLAADQVSWLHAVVWIEGGRLWVRDLGSTNGTFVGGERLKAPMAIDVSSRVRLAPGVELRFDGELPHDPAAFRLMMLEDEESKIRFPLIGDRFFIGTAPGSDIVLEEGPEEAVVLTVYEDGEVWLGGVDEERSLELGDVLDLGGRRLVLKIADERGPTPVAERARYPYRLTVDLQGAAGAEALVEDLRTGQRCEIRAENRAVLLYILGKKLKEDSGEIEARRGWCTDDEVSSGVWGRSRKNQAGSYLHVLIHRLRNQLKDAQIDPWFIEKKRKHIRLRVDEIVIRE